MELEIFGRTICLELQKNEMTLGNGSAPISILAAKCSLTIVVDRCSMELFADSGKIYMACLDNQTLCDRNLPYLVIRADHETVIESIEMHSLHSIWS